tara:strand:- start:419 stop:790 length:372 start_codon:yes stop_codon:yes gene_type:complete
MCEEIYKLDKIIKNLQIPIIVTNKEELIIGLNKYWIEMCKYTLNDLYQKIPYISPKILHGKLTNREITSIFKYNLIQENCAFGSFINYTKWNEIFENHVFAWSCGEYNICETFVFPPPIVNLS